MSIRARYRSGTFSIRWTAGRKTGAYVECGFILPLPLCVFVGNAPTESASVLPYSLLDFVISSSLTQK